MKQGDYMLAKQVGGKGYYGQVRLEVGDSDFSIDLLFYHLKLRCFVVPLCLVIDATQPILYSALVVEWTLRKGAVDGATF